MGIKQIIGENHTVLYCSVTMTPLGLILDVDDNADDFLEYLNQDARHYTDKELRSKYYEWKGI